MYRFLCHLLLFLSVVIGILYVLINMAIITRPQYCSNPEATTFIMGNSRIKNGIDDTSLPGCWSMGSDAADFNLLYDRLRLLHAYNPQLNRVILSTDSRGLYNYRQSHYYYFYPYLWDFLTSEDWFFLLRYDRDALLYMFDWKKVLFPIFAIWRGDNLRNTMLGGFSPVSENRLTESLAKEQFDRLVLDEKTPFCPLQVRYLDKIYEYCQLNDIELTFLNMPSYPTEHVKLINRNTQHQLQERYPDIRLLNYELITLPDTCYYDIYHLNYEGAVRFTEIIKADIIDK